MEDKTCKIDSINNLPDGVLLQIVSFLPLEEAVRTSILSWRWRNLWSPTLLNIIIDQTPTSSYVKDSVDSFTDKFLRSFESTKSQNFHFFRQCSGDHPPENEMTIRAVKGVQKEVCLQFLSSKETKLGFELKLNQTVKPSSLSSLKTLHVRSVSNLESSFVSSLFSSCWFLETLKIEKCRDLKSVTIEKNNGLQNLAIVDCPEIESVVVTAARMVSFSYRGVLPIIELKNVTSLTEVELDFNGGPRYGEFECEDLINLFAAMGEVGKLKMSGWILQWLCSGGVIYSRLEFQLSRLKELTWIDASIDDPKRNSLACFLNICPVLTKLFIRIDAHRLHMPCPLFHQYWHEPHLWSDSPTNDVVPLEHLRVVEMSGFAEEEMLQASLMLDLMVEKAAGSLQEMAITSA